MDPNVTLAQLREALKLAQLRAALNKEDFEAYWLFKSLDGWLSRGGFLPDDWKPQPPVCDNSLIDAFKKDRVREIDEMNERNRQEWVEDN
jgi:hypothetical protein